MRLGWVPGVCRFCKATVFGEQAGLQPAGYLCEDLRQRGLLRSGRRAQTKIEAGDGDAAMVTDAGE
jgi:hypothetical protein